MVDFYKHNIAAWRGGTASLTHEQYRVYHVIIEEIMVQEGPILPHERMLAGLANMSVRSFRAAFEVLISAGKLRMECGRVTNVRAGKELEFVRNNRHNSKSGGISSGKTRRESSERLEKVNNNNDGGEAPLRMKTKPKREEEIREEKITPHSPPRGADGVLPLEEPTGASANGSRSPIDELFRRFWSAYPKREGNPRKPAAERFERAVRKGADPEAIIRGANAYAAMLERNDKAGTQFVALATTWLNQQRWLDDYEPTAPPKRFHMV